MLTVMFSSLEMKATIGGKHPHLLYCLAPAMRPRMLLTLDEQEQLLPIPVRVGQAVDTVAQVSMSSRCQIPKCFLPAPPSFQQDGHMPLSCRWSFPFVYFPFVGRVLLGVMTHPLIILW